MCKCHRCRRDELLLNHDLMCVLIDAPWCKHCNDMQAAWQQLALHFKKDPSVVIASIDATRNDLPGLRFVGAYPTLMFFPMSEQLRVCCHCEQHNSDLVGYRLL